MTLVSKDKLFWAEMGSNEVLVFLTVLFVSLKSATCDLSLMLQYENDGAGDGDVLFSLCTPPVGGNA